MFNVREKEGRQRKSRPRPAEGLQDIRKHLRSALLELCVRHSDGASTRAARRRKRTRGKASRRGDGNRLGRSDDAKVRSVPLYNIARYKTQIEKYIFSISILPGVLH